MLNFLPALVRTIHRALKGRHHVLRKDKKKYQPFRGLTLKRLGHTRACLNRFLILDPKLSVQYNSSCIEEELIGPVVEKLQFQVTNETLNQQWTYFTTPNVCLFVPPSVHANHFGRNISQNLINVSNICWSLSIIALLLVEVLFLVW